MSLSSDSLVSCTTELSESLLLLSLKSHKHCQSYSASDFSKKLNFCRSISMLFSSLAQQTVESTRCREKPVAKSSPVINFSSERLPASCIWYCNKLSLRDLAFFLATCSYHCSWLFYFLKQSVSVVFQSWTGDHFFCIFLCPHIPWLHRYINRYIFLHRYHNMYQ